MKYNSISFIIPAYKNQQVLDLCLNSIFTQTRKIDEVIVVDDASNPPIQIKIPEIKILFLTKNLGPANARNLGALQAKGDILFFVDSDIILDSEARERVLTGFSEKNVVAIHGIYSIPSYFKDFISAYKNIYWNFNQINRSDNSFSICSAILAVPQKIFLTYGGFNTDSTIGEDREFGLFLKEKGHHVSLDKNLTGTHIRKFSFQQLMQHHFQNTVSLIGLLLASIRKHGAETASGGAGHNQRLSILISPLVFFIIIASIAIRELYLLGILLLAFGGFLFICWPFIRYCYENEGIYFSINAFFLFFCESLIAFFGILYGIYRFFLLKEKRLNFKLGKQ